MTRNIHRNHRNRRNRFTVPVVLAACSLGFFVAARDAAIEPEPPVVSPGKAATDQTPIPAPSDAIVLFDGTSLDAWRTDAGKPPSWILEGKPGEHRPGGCMSANPGQGGIFSKQNFGDAQIHVEFATPSEIHGDGQERGNSGVYIQGRYEVQVLDSFNNKTYSNGQCGAIYGQHAPLVNACREPGQWQTYDIIFHAAKFDQTGSKTHSARITVLHNGVLIQDHVEATSPTTAAPVQEAASQGPIFLQDHGNTVRYRNIWVRPLGVSK